MVTLNTIYLIVLAMFLIGMMIVQHNRGTIQLLSFRNTFLFKPLLTFTEFLDTAVLKIPLVRKMAWQVIFELSDPKQGN